MKTGGHSLSFHSDVGYDTKSHKDNKHTIKNTLTDAHMEWWVPEGKGMQEHKEGRGHIQHNETT